MRDERHERVNVLAMVLALITASGAALGCLSFAVLILAPAPTRILGLVTLIGFAVMGAGFVALDTLIEGDAK